MHTTTLQGVFPESKPAFRRNFIKENVRSIKQMQGLLQEAGVIQPRNSRETDKFRNVPSFFNRSRETTPQRKRSESEGSKKTVNRSDKKKTQASFRNVKLKLDKKMEPSETTDEKFTNRSVQTERTEDLTKLYETGVIKYPSPGVLKSRSPKASFAKTGEMQGQGDQEQNSVEKDLQNLAMEEKDYVKENMTNIKPKLAKPSTAKVPSQPPPGYQRGVVPKYLRDRKDEDHKEVEDENCPDGHVLLPEEERKETLRVLRQSYADRIQELNSLPVRSDTLRVKKRKMEIEEELKRIDGGIKVFQRPKVYVKINA